MGVRAVRTPLIFYSRLRNVTNRRFARGLTNKAIAEELGAMATPRGDDQGT